jgi:hypothetical protein
MAQYRVFLERESGWQMLSVVSQSEKKRRAEALRKEGFTGKIVFRRSPANPTRQKIIPLPDAQGRYPNPW